MNETYPGQMPTPPPAPQVQRKKQPADTEMVDKLAKDINNMAANLRILEERHSLMRNKSVVTEQSLIELDRSITKEIKSLSEEMIELKHELKDIMEKLSLISAEMKSLANKDEIRVLERYIDLWQPMNFVSRAELDKTVKEAKGK